MHTQRLEDSADRATGDDARALLGHAEHHLASAEMAADIVMQRAALAEVHTNHRPLGLLRRLTDGLRHFACLAGAVADPAAAVADNDQRGKAEATAALYHLGNAVDADQLFDQLRFFAIPRTL